MTNINLFILIFGIIFWIFCHTTWVIFGYGMYYIGTATIIFISSHLIHSVQKRNTYSRIITRLFLFLSFNNLLDEIFFDPKVFDINEYIIFIFYLIYTLCGSSFKKQNKC